MNDVLLKVRPLAHAWMVECPEAVEPLAFLSGARAEAQAHALARVIAQAGSDARVVVHDRRGQLVGATRYAAAG